MGQLNIHLTPAFEENLREYMRLRGLKTNSEAVRKAVEECLNATRSGVKVDFRDWIGMAADGQSPLSRPRRSLGEGLMVLDTSAVLAVAFNEPLGKWASERMHEHRGYLCMSTVNLTETLIVLRDRQPQAYPRLERSSTVESASWLPISSRLARRHRRACATS